jgi:endo-1,4-beta-xylanase
VHRRVDRSARCARLLVEHEDGSQSLGTGGAVQVGGASTWKAFCDRHPNTKLIDVVNEPPPHTTPAYIDGIGGAGTSGYDWIVNAFKWARASCPNATLILNDYNIIEYSNDNAHIIDIVTKIKAAGAPIDAIGAQAHDAYKISTSTVKRFIDKLAGTGLPVYITEYDIPVADDAMQKSIMQDRITMYWNDDNVKGITLWGYIVGATWKANTGIQQTDGTMRPAMTWLMGFLGRPTT